MTLELQIQRHWRCEVISCCNANSLLWCLTCLCVWERIELTVPEIDREGGDPPRRRQRWRCCPPIPNVDLTDESRSIPTFHFVHPPPSSPLLSFPSELMLIIRTSTTLHIGSERLFSTLKL